MFSLSAGQSIFIEARTVYRTICKGSLYVGISRSISGQSSGLSGRGTGVRRSGHIVCRYPRNKVANAYDSAKHRTRMKNASRAPHMDEGSTRNLPTVEKRQNP